MDNEDRSTTFLQKEGITIAILLAGIIFIGIPLFRGVSEGISSEFMAIMIVGTVASLFGFIVWTLSSNKTQRARIEAQSDLLNRMLDRFDSPVSMISFLESPVGQQAFDSLSQRGQTGKKRLQQAVSSLYEDEE